MAEPTVAQRKAFAKAGYSMPDGSYYIREGATGVADLERAVQAVGRSTDAHDDVRKHIIARAKAIGKSDMIPDTWNPDGSLKHDAWIAEVEAYLSTVAGDSLEHFGVKGMRWGVRRPRGTTSQHPVSADAARARATQETIKKHGTSAVSNVDLQHLVTRLNLESQHGKLNQDHVDAGRKEVQKFLIQFGKQQASALANQAIKSGAEALSKKYSK
jgi:hypothetical protein